MEYTWLPFLFTSVSIFDVNDVLSWLFHWQLQQIMIDYNNIIIVDNNIIIMIIDDNNIIIRIIDDKNTVIMIIDDNNTIHDHKT